MTVWTDLEDIANDPNMTPDEKRLASHETKCFALSDVLNNGRPPPNPVPPVVGQTFTLDGYTITVHFAADELLQNGVHALRLIMTVKLGAAFVIKADEDHFIINPPVITNDGRQDLIDAAKEFIRNEIANAEAIG